MKDGRKCVTMIGHKRVQLLTLIVILVLSSVTFFGFATKAKAATTVGINKVTTTVVKKVDKTLMKGKEMNLKVKGSKTTATNKVKTIQKQIKKVNQQGIIFKYSKGKKSGNCYIFKVSSENAKLYMYGVKFIKKLYSSYRTKLRTDDALKYSIADMKKYPNATTRKLRITYDYLLKHTLAMTAGVECKNNRFVINQDSYARITGYDNPSTQTNANLTEFYEKKETYKKLMIKSQEEVKETKGDTTYYNMIYHFRSFKEFSALASAKNVVKKMQLIEISAQQKMALTKKFCDLSDAMKIYVIDGSDYFCGTFKRSGFQMIYSYTYQYPSSSSKAMKTLYQNKAKGVCAVFANYERIVFEQLGIKCYTCSSGEINHAWTVVRVKNSSWKTLWIPFDYGIGPNPYLLVPDNQRKYISTEKKRYKLYLSGIKGAPKKKNFTANEFK